MIFSPVQIPLIVSGRKTMTRCTSTRARAGNTAAAQPGPGRRAIGRIHINTIDTEPLHAITRHPHDVRAEGHDRLHDFAVHWLADHDPHPAYRKAARQMLDGTRPQALLDPIEDMLDRHGHRQVHVITFTWLSEQPLFLAAGSGYTTDPRRALTDPGDQMHGPPEVVHPDELATLPNGDAAQRRWNHARREAARERSSLPIGQRVALIQAEARLRGIDVSGPLKEAERQIARAEKRLGKEAA